MNIRVELHNGDSRQGRYVRHDDKFLTIHSTGRFRLIQLRMIADIIEIKPKQFQSCLKAVK